MSALIALATVACSSQQLYAVGQGWQRQECNRIQEAQEWQRCMQSTATSFDEYRRQAEQARSGSSRQ
jgi:hypothetical protein